MTSRVAGWFVLLVASFALGYAVYTFPKAAVTFWLVPSVVLVAFTALVWDRLNMTRRERWYLAVGLALWPAMLVSMASEWVEERLRG